MKKILLMASLLATTGCFTMGDQASQNQSLDQGPVGPGTPAPQDFSDSYYDLPKAAALSEFFAEPAVQRLYRGVLQREADPGGLRDYREMVLRDGFSGWIEMHRVFVESQEYSENVGSKQDSRSILDAMYNGVLGPNRPLDSFGAREFLPMISDGRTRTVLNTLGTCDEFLEKVFDFARWDGRSSILVQKVYASLLGRAPNSTELSDKSSKTLGLRDLFKLIEELILSEEYKNLVQTRLSSSQVVERFFLGFVSRRPTPEELALYRKVVEQGKPQLAAMSILLRPEFFRSL